MGTDHSADQHVIPLWLSGRLANISVAEFANPRSVSASKSAIVGGLHSKSAAVFTGERDDTHGDQQRQRHPPLTIRAGPLSSHLRFPCLKFVHADLVGC